MTLVTDTFVKNRSNFSVGGNPQILAGALNSAGNANSCQPKIPEYPLSDETCKIIIPLKPHKPIQREEGKPILTRKDATLGAIQTCYRDIEKCKTKLKHLTKVMIQHRF